MGSVLLESATLELFAITTCLSALNSFFCSLNIKLYSNPFSVWIVGAIFAFTRFARGLFGLTAIPVSVSRQGCGATGAPMWQRRCWRYAAVALAAS